MFQKFSLTFALLILSFYGSAQTSDSLVIKFCTYEEDSPAPEGFPQNFKEIFYYDSLGNLFMYKHEEFNSNMIRIRLIDSVYYDYDANHNLILSSRYYIYGMVSNVGLAKYQQDQYSYDSLNRVSNHKFEYKTNVTQNWVLHSDTYYSYNQSGIVDSTWTAGGALPYAQSLRFDSIQNLETYLTWKGDSTGALQPENSRRKWKNANGSDTLTINQSWNGIKWINTSKDIVRFNALDWQIYRLNCRGEDTNWVNNQQTTYTYDSTGNYYSNIAEFWNDTNSVWVPYSLQIVDKRAHPPLTINYYLLWDPLTSDWDSTWKSNTRVDSVGQIVSETDYTYETGHWSSSTFTYDQFGNRVYSQSNGHGYSSSKSAIYNSENQILHTEAFTFSQQTGKKRTICDYYRIKPDSILVTHPDSTEYCAGEQKRIEGILLYPNSPISIRWTPSTGISNDTILNPIISATSTTNYQLIISNANGDTSVKNIVVTVLPPPQAPLIDSIVPPGRCYPDTITYFIVQPNLNFYQWRSTNGSLALNNDSLTYSKYTNTDYYFVIGYDSKGCSNSSDTIEASLQSPPFTRITVSPSSYCLGDTITLTAVPYFNSTPSTYSWKYNGQDTTGINATTILSTQNGVYSVYAVDSATGCDWTWQYTTQFNEINHPATIIAYPDTFACRNESILLHSAFSDSSWYYTWYDNTQIINSANGQDSIYVSNGSSYLLKIQNGNCISISDSIKLFFNPFRPYLNLNGIVEICTPDSLQLQVTPGVQYLWSTGETTTQISADTSGQYNCYVTDSLGCTILSNTLSLIVNTPGPNPVITWIYPFLISSIPGPGTVQWYLNDILIPGADSSIHVPLADGTYKVSYIDSNNCEVFSAGYYYSLTNINVTKESSKPVVYPSPVQVYGIFSYMGSGEVMKWEIYNSSFQLIKVYNNPAKQFTFSRGDLSSGIYFVRTIIKLPENETSFWLRFSIAD